MTLEIGSVLHGRYQIISLVGQGGMGAIYKAMDTLPRSPIPVAVKEFLLGYLPHRRSTQPLTGNVTRGMSTKPPTDKEATYYRSRDKTQPLTLENAIDQFKHEARILYDLRHPNLPRVSDYFEVDHNHYLVMEYIDGKDLDTILMENNDQPLSYDRVMGWFSKILDAVDYCHSQGVTHRDIKPANIMLSPDGNVYLVDFGIAKLTEHGVGTVLRGRSEGFSSIEQYTRHALISERSDIYMIGASLYNVLTGQIPENAVDRIAGTSLLDPQLHNPKIPLRVAKAIMKAMEIKAEDRFQTVNEFITELWPSGVKSVSITAKPKLAELNQLTAGIQNYISILEKENLRLKRQVDSLKVQEKAFTEKHKNLVITNKQEMQILEDSIKSLRETLSEQQYQSEEMQNQVSNLEERLFNTQTTAERIEQDLVDTQAILDSQTIKNEELEKLLLEKQSKIISLQTEIECTTNLSGDFNLLLEKTGKLTLELDDQKRLVAEWENKFSKLEQITHQLETMKNEADRSLISLTDQQADILKSRDDLRDVVRGNQVQITQLLDQNADLERRYADLVNEKKNLESILENTRQAAEVLQTKLNRLSSNTGYLNPPATVTTTDLSTDPNKIELINRVNKLIAEKQQLYQENKALRDELDSLSSSRVEISELKDKITCLGRTLDEKDAILQQKEQQLKLQSSRSGLLASTDYGPQAQIQLLKDENEKLAREVLFQRGNNLTIYRRLLELHDRYPVQCEEVLTSRWIRNVRILVDDAARNEPTTK